MKIKLSKSHNTIKLSKKDFFTIGKKAGWIKSAQYKSEMSIWWQNISRDMKKYPALEEIVEDALKQQPYDANTMINNLMKGTLTSQQKSAWLTLKNHIEQTIWEMEQ